jgi:hypothetical protein
MNKRNSLWKNIPRLFLSFVGALLLASFGVLLVVRMTFLSQGYIERVAEKTGYYKGIARETNLDLAQGALGANVPAGTLDKVITTSRVKTDVDNYFTALYTPGVSYHFSQKDDLHRNLSEAIETAAVESGRAVDASSLDQLVMHLSSMYEGYVEIPYLLAFGQKMMQYKSLLTIALFVIAVVTLVLFLVIYVSLRRYNHRLYRYLSYSLTTAGLMGLVVPIMVWVSKFTSRIPIQSETMYGFVKAYLDGAVGYLSIISTVLIVIGGIFAVSSEKIRQNILS